MYVTCRSRLVTRKLSFPRQRDLRRGKLSGVWADTLNSSALQAVPSSPPTAALSSCARGGVEDEKPVRPDQSRAEMAADRTGTTLEEHDIHSSDLMLPPEPGCNIPKRHARVTVKYNRKELQKRLDVEKWIDDSLDRLYSGQVGACVRQRAALEDTA